MDAPYLHCNTRSQTWFTLDITVEIVDECDVVQRRVISWRQGQDSPMAYASLLLTSKPKMVRIDPENNVLFKLDFNPGLDIVANTARMSGDVSSRLRSMLKLVT